jgi:hypothetical protein
MSASVPIVPQGIPVVGPVVNIYNEAVDPSNVLTPEQIEEAKQNQLTSFSPGLAVFLSIITFGLFSTIYYQLKQDQLPKLMADDPSAGKAIGFMFIPLFNIYWYFIAWPRLIDRINLQFRLRGVPAPISRSQVMMLLIATFVGWIVGLGLLVAFVLWIMLIISTQKAINQLAAERGA